METQRFKEESFSAGLTDGAGGSGPSRGTAALKTQTGFSTASSVQTGVGQAGMVG